MQVLGLSSCGELRVQTVHDLFVRSTLERNRLSLVVESQVEEERDLNTVLGFAAFRTRLDDTANDRSSVEGWSLAAKKKNKRGSVTGFVI